MAWRKRKDAKKIDWEEIAKDLRADVLSQSRIVKFYFK